MCIFNYQNTVMIMVMGGEFLPQYSGSYKTWDNPGKDYVKHNPETINPNGLRDIAGAHYPSIGLYDVTDPDYQEYMMQCLKMCYIDTVNYYVERDVDIEPDKTIWGRNFDTLVIPMLRKYGLSATLRLAGPARYADKDGNLDKPFNSLLDKLGDSVAKLNGRPLVAQFSINGITPEAINKWKENYALSHNGVKPFFMTPQTGYQLITVDWPSACDGQFGWIELDERKPINEYEENYGDYWRYADLDTAKQNHDKMVERAKKYKENRMVPFYAESLTPAFDDVSVWAWNLGHGPRKIDGGENGELYEYKWQSAIKNKSPMVVIPTWDDWGEGTTIEPSLDYGVTYLELTKKYAAQYKGIESHNVSLELPVWIYKIRKSTDNKAILSDMDKASELIANGEYANAEALVKPYVKNTAIPVSSTEFFERN